MREFVTAAKDTFEAEEKVATTFLHDETEVTFYEPSVGKQAVMLGFGRGTTTLESASTFIALFFSMMDAKTRRYFEDRLMDDDDPFDLKSDGGIFDLWEALVEEWGGKATSPPSASSSPQRKTGRASTATTRAKARTS